MVCLESWWDSVLWISSEEQKVKKAIFRLASGKTPWSDDIPAEIYKTGGPNIIKKLTELLCVFWERRLILQELKEASIHHLFTRKGHRNVCDNHRGISLLGVVGKILARVMLMRMICHLEQGLCPESQCGFRQGRDTVDMNFAARQLLEKCLEQNNQLYTTFVDFTKTFDTVSRDRLWKLMAKFGCSDISITMVRQFHYGITAKVLDDGECSDTFSVSNGVKKRCVLAPTLFSMVFAAMLSDTFLPGDLGVPIRYKTDGKLFTLRRLQAITKVKETVLRDFLLADDYALNSHTE